MSGQYGTAALPKLNSALEILDSYLAKTKWVAGPEVTLADFTLVVSISCLEVIFNFLLIHIHNPFSGKSTIDIRYHMC